MANDQQTTFSKFKNIFFNDLDDREADKKPLAYLMPLGAVIVGVLGLIIGYQAYGLGASLVFAAGGGLAGAFIGALAWSLFKFTVRVAVVAIPIIVIVGALYMMWSVKF